MKSQIWWRQILMEEILSPNAALHGSIETGGCNLRLVVLRLGSWAKILKMPAADTHCEVHAGTYK